MPLAVWWYMESHGLVPLTCWPYQSGDGKVPPCTSKCPTGEAWKEYKVKSGSVTSHFTAESMMTELLNRGPFEVSFAVRIQKKQNTCRRSAQWLTSVRIFRFSLIS
jgi:hypothetical protein